MSLGAWLGRRFLPQLIFPPAINVSDIRSDEVVDDHVILITSQLITLHNMLYEREHVNN